MDILTTKTQLRLYLLLPLILSLAGAALHFWPLLALSALAVFALTGLLPMCAGRESLWIFLAVLPASVPANVFLLRRLSSFWLLRGFAETRLDGLLWSVLGLLTLLSLELIPLLILSRVIWPEQQEDETFQQWIEEENKTRRGKRT